MPFLLLILLTTSAMGRPDNTATLFDFSIDTPSGTWRVQDDVVMGGRSSGHFNIDENGHGHFFGKVSLENNGGFSSVMHSLEEPYSLEARTAFRLRIKGDGKPYAFRVQSTAGQRFYHRAEFTTSGEWETITIPFASMEAVFRGRRVNVPNFDGQDIHKLQILIGNGKAQKFELMIDVIEVI